MTDENGDEHTIRKASGVKKALLFTTGTISLFAIGNAIVGGEWAGELLGKLAKGAARGA